MAFNRQNNGFNEFEQKKIATTTALNHKNSGVNALNSKIAALRAFNRQNNGVYDFYPEKQQR